MGRPGMTPLRRVQVARILARANLAGIERPDRVVRAMTAIVPWGTSPAGILAVAAVRAPTRVAVVDDAGETTYSKLWTQARRVASGLSVRGVAPGVRVGLL